MVRFINPLIVCITSKKIMRDSISKALAKEGWPIVFQETLEAAIDTRQDTLTTVIIDPLFDTACPNCGKLADWANLDIRCSCGFKPKRGKNPYNDLGEADKLTIIILPYHANKFTVTKLRERGYWVVRLKKEHTILDLPKVIKLSLKTMSKYYRM